MISSEWPMKSWCDLNMALNRLVREGTIEGFRTNRDEKNADPKIVFTLRADMKEEWAVHAVMSVLTGVFAYAELAAEIIDRVV